METLPIDFHILAALWTSTAGAKFEERLSPQACGNRLRRNKENQFNRLSLGSCRHYFTPYRSWRDDAVRAMGAALDEDKSIVAVTADVSAFYHRISPKFILNPSFHKLLKVQLTAEEDALNRLFIHYLLDWAEVASPLPGGNLPVGLTASSVIANLALWELDQIISQEIVPRYYGRYVDDIILVVENVKDFTRSTDVWDWLVKRSGGAITVEGEEVHFKRDYLEDCTITFKNSKNKTFALSGPSGKSMLSLIRQQMSERTSEWRAMPDIPESESALEAKVVAVAQEDGLPADSLRRADKVSIRRSGFAIQIRDLEAYARLLPPEAWKRQRHAFYEAFIRHVLVLPHFFDFYNYLSRILSLATFCRDYKHLRRMLDSLQNILVELQNCERILKSFEDGQEETVSLLNQFTANLKVRVNESIVTAIPFELKEKYKRDFHVAFEKDCPLFNFISIEHLQKTRRRYLKADLAYRPLKSFLLPACLTGRHSHPTDVRKELFKKSLNPAEKALPDSIQDGHSALCSIVNSEGAHLPGFLFPTRPPSLVDLYYLENDPFNEEGRQRIVSILLSCRGYSPEDSLPSSGRDESEQLRITFSCKHIPTDEIGIGITNWKTDIKSWTAAASKKHDPDSTRLARVSRLVDEVLSRGKGKISYLIFPELALPASWFYSIAYKLKAINVSLISGVEYVHESPDIVHNQVWCSLLHDSLGYRSSALYKQDKQFPAIHEESELNNIAGKQLRPQVNWLRKYGHDSPPILRHGNLEFALLICSELTNISYRTALRGKIDALFIPEWNQDTDSFNALIESSALDIHAFIIQCNDRSYGDSRIRAPYKKPFQRDIVRTKGGLDDYFVIAKINFQSLRVFQSAHRSPPEPFKPVPDGFQISKSRRTLPKAES